MTALDISSLPAFYEVILGMLQSNIQDKLVLNKAHCMSLLLKLFIYLIIDKQVGFADMTTSHKLLTLKTLNFFKY